MVNIIHNNHWRLLFKSPKENIIYKRIILEIQTILQKKLQTANVVSDYW